MNRWASGNKAYFTSLPESGTRHRRVSQGAHRGLCFDPGYRQIMANSAREDLSKSTNSSSD